jgi:hypothetical protein
MDTTDIATDRPPCPLCGGFIQTNSPVTRANLFDPWQHVTCPRTKFDFDPGDVCPNCFTVRTTTGACNCA